jgi:hypothetical protein
MAGPLQPTEAKYEKNNIWHIADNRERLAQRLRL